MPAGKRVVTQNGRGTANQQKTNVVRVISSSDREERASLVGGYRPGLSRWFRRGSVQGRDSPRFGNVLQAPVRATCVDRLPHPGLRKPAETSEFPSVPRQARRLPVSPVRL